MSERFRVPERILGPIDDELASFIGRVAMLASIVETQLAGIASNLGEGTQGAYASEPGSSSIAFIRKRTAEVEQSRYEASFASSLNPIWSAPRPF